MTAVEFHTGIEDPVGFACKLLRKAFRQGVRVLVTAPEAVLARLDRALWVFEERDFIPHLRLSGPGSEKQALAAQTPIWLSAAANHASAPNVVLNLGASAPIDMAPIERLIEVVSNEPDEVQAGRLRWRQYKALGLDVMRHPNTAPAA